MKLHEALSKFDPSSNLWMRPVSWKGTKEGFIIKNKMIYAVPSSNGGIPSITAYVDFLIEDWEIVDCGSILDGN